MRVPCGCALLAVSGILGGFWFIGMSWSHDFGSSSFQLQEALVVGGAFLAFLGGVALLASGPGRSDENDKNERAPDPE